LQNVLHNYRNLFLVNVIGSPAGEPGFKHFKVAIGGLFFLPVISSRIFSSKQRAVYFIAFPLYQPVIEEKKSH